MAGVIRGRSPLILAVEDAPQLCCGVIHFFGKFLLHTPGAVLLFPPFDILHNFPNLPYNKVQEILRYKL